MFFTIVVARPDFIELRVGIADGFVELAGPAKTSRMISLKARLGWGILVKRMSMGSLAC